MNITLQRKRSFFLTLILITGNFINADAQNKSATLHQLNTILVNTVMVDFPAGYHGRAAGFSFADGHSEIHKWRDPRTTPVLKKGVPLPLNQSQPKNPDIVWMQDHSTRLK